MKTGWLIYSKEDAVQNASFIDWFIEEANKQTLALNLILREEMTIGIVKNQQCVQVRNESVDLPDFAIVRSIEPLLNLHLEALGVSVFNSSIVSSICNNKALTHHHINQLGLPMVDTIYSKRESIQDTPPLAYPFIAKEVSGRGGKQVYYIENAMDWMNCKMSIQTDIIIQSSDVQLGKDLRVFVVGKEIVAAVLRESSTDFRANYKLGGSAQLYKLNEEEENLIHQIIKTFDFGMVGIDFLIGHEDELLLNEIEDVVGSRTLSAADDVNILEKYISHIKKSLL
ncbi:ATP-grasp domain-containing protein [Oceanobacillus sp. CF4.6]|uniref:ATP-grasp domain-containing protein n=1 Tax=Oceanobacillus sp. CF4.6 TaxID=3373080 RepID=UPI003EE5451B